MLTIIVTTQLSRDNYEKREKTRKIPTCAIGISSRRDTKHTKDRKEEKSHMSL